MPTRERGHDVEVTAVAAALDPEVDQPEGLAAQVLPPPLLERLAIGRHSRLHLLQTLRAGIAPARAEQREPPPHLRAE